MASVPTVKKCPNCSSDLPSVPIRCRTCDSIIVQCTFCGGTGQSKVSLPVSAERNEVMETTCTVCSGNGIIDERRLYKRSEM